MRSQAELSDVLQEEALDATNTGRDLQDAVETYNRAFDGNLQQAIDRYENLGGNTETLESR